MKYPFIKNMGNDRNAKKGAAGEGEHTTGHGAKKFNRVKVKASKREKDSGENDRAEKIKDAGNGKSVKGKNGQLGM